MFMAPVHCLVNDRVSKPRLVLIIVESLKWLAPSAIHEPIKVMFDYLCVSNAVYRWFSSPYTDPTT